MQFDLNKKEIENLEK